MNRSEAVHSVLTDRIRRLEPAIISARRSAAFWHLLSAIPLVGAVALVTAGGVKQAEPWVGLVISVATVGLTFVFWNLGGTPQEAMQHAVSERKRLENILLFLTAVDTDSLTPDLLAKLLTGDSTLPGYRMEGRGAGMAYADAETKEAD